MSVIEIMGNAYASLTGEGRNVIWQVIKNSEQNWLKYTSHKNGQI